MLTATPRPDFPNNGGSTIRQVVEVVALLGIAVSMFRTFAAEGYMISTGSMAPTLLGYHKQVTCPDCSFRFAFGISVDDETGQLKSSGYAKCPHCGLGPIDVKQLPPVEGDQLLVHKNAYDFRDPKRWEVVIFRNPQNLSQAYVKRVVGLPGEKVLLDNGNVIIDGELVSKPWSVHKATRIPVFDSQYPISSEFNREMGTWTFDESSGWTRTESGFHFSPGNAQTSRALHYQHREMAADVVSHQISDRYGYNRLSAHRNRYDVEELSLRCEFQPTSKSGTIQFELQHKTTSFICELNLKSGDIVLSNDQQRQLTHGKSEAITPGQMTTIDFSVVDARVYVAINDGLVIDFKIAGKASPSTLDEPKRDTNPIQIRCQKADVQIQHLQIYRDVYYTPKDTVLRTARETVKLGDDEFFVLGDNSPNSIDSRNWPTDSVKRNLLIGKPLVVHLPSRPGRIRWAGNDYHIRMPDISRIRLIH